MVGVGEGPVQKMLKYMYFMWLLRGDWRVESVDSFLSSLSSLV